MIPRDTAPLSEIDQPAEVCRPRQDWEAMAENGDDKPLDADVPLLTIWNEAEWE